MSDEKKKQFHFCLKIKTLEYASLLHYVYNKSHNRCIIIRLQFILYKLQSL